jgi:hypothetical protein
MDVIKVKSTLGNRVALYEKDPAHPGEEGRPGEAFIANSNKVYTVAKTPLVLEQLSRGWLVEVGVKADKPKKETATNETKDKK